MKTPPTPPTISDVFSRIASRTGAPERRCIAAIRRALQEYDHEVRPDGRRQNGGQQKRVDRHKVRLGIIYLQSEGLSIRKAAAKAGITYATLWTAKERLRLNGVEP